MDVLRNPLLTGLSALAVLAAVGGSLPLLAEVEVSRSHQELMDPDSGVGMLNKFCALCGGNAEDN